MSNEEWREKRHPPPATRHLPYLYCLGCSLAAPEYSLTNKIVSFTIFVRINILVRRMIIMILTSKITSKGQITLPKEVRKLLNVQEGNVIIFEKENDKIVIKPAKTLRDFKGLLKNTKKEETFDEIRKIVKNSVGKRVIQGGR